MQQCLRCARLRYVLVQAAPNDGRVQAEQMPLAADTEVCTLHAVV